MRTWRDQRGVDGTDVSQLCTNSVKSCKKYDYRVRTRERRVRSQGGSTVTRGGRDLGLTHKTRGQVSNREHKIIIKVPLAATKLFIIRLLTLLLFSVFVQIYTHFIVSVSHASDHCWHKQRIMRMVITLLQSPDVLQNPREKSDLN